MRVLLGIDLPAGMLVIPYQHDVFLVMVALCIAVAAAFVTQSLMEQLTVMARTGVSALALRVGWLSSAFCMGGGVWALHFISLLALRAPIQRDYDVGLTVLSLLIVIAASAWALHLLQHARPRWALWQAAVVSGLGIVLMHYLGMLSMRMVAVQLYNPGYVLLVLPLAMGTAYLGFYLVQHLHDNASTGVYLSLKLATSLVMALGVAAVHFVGMHGMRLILNIDVQAYVQRGPAADTEMGLVVGVVAMLIMLIGLISGGWVQRSLYLQRNALSQTAMRLQQASDYDPLTGLYNSRAFRERLEMRLAALGEAHNALILWLDLDQFKRINDSLGHAQGDELLVQVALRLRGALPGGAILGRYAADEFCAVISDGDVANLQEIPQRLREQLEPPLQLSDTALQLSASIGYTYYPDDGRNSAELLRDAGIALGWCKKNGRNRSQRFSLELAGEAQMDLRLEQDLRQAIDQNELQVYFQPIVRGDSGEVEALEALVRWPHAVFGMINPERFVGLAEQCGMIGELDAWVMQRAAREVRELHEHGRKIRVGVNCSALNLSDPELPMRVELALRSSGLPASYLTLEITENALMGNVLQAAQSLQKIRELGVKVSIDDFGTGYSSLAYLRKLPVNALKIDRSFIRELDINRQDQELTGAIIAMAHKLQLRVVAEGVESLKHVALLREQQCDLLQGFWFSRPLPMSELREWLSLYRPVDVLPPTQQAS